MESTFQRKERNMLVAEKFIRSLLTKYVKHTVYTDRGIFYQEACNVLRLKNYLHSLFEKSLMERVNYYFKDRTESFDDYYPFTRDDCDLLHVYKWVHFFVSVYNDTIYRSNYFIKSLERGGKSMLN